MKRWMLLLLVGCGTKTSKIDVNLVASADELLSPYSADVGLAKIRVRIEASVEDGLDEAVVDLDRSARATTFENFPSDTIGRVRVDGFDTAGNTVVFGRATVALDGDVSVDVPFRRNLAYAIHNANGRAAAPESHIYVLDMASRTLLQKIQLPGTAPRAFGVSARGGDSILVTYGDQGNGFVGVIDAATHEVRAFPLPVVQEIAVASPESDEAVVAGGGQITLLNLETGATEVLASDIGGLVLDAAMAPTGNRAIIALTTIAYSVDVAQRDVDAVPVLPEIAGVAIAASTDVAYLTSALDGSVAAMNLATGETVRRGSFVRPVGCATFSEEFNALLAVHTAQDTGTSRVLAFLPFVQDEAARGLSFADGNMALNFPSGCTTGAAGRRVLVTAVGTSTDTAGLTMLETFSTSIPDSSSTLYPLDPDDTFFGGRLRQRWQPRGVAAIYSH